MMQCDSMFTVEDRQSIYSFYETRERWKTILNFREIAPKKTVDTIFYGDSIVEAWPTQEFFPGLLHLNRGIGGDNINGLYFRMDDDIFPYSPRRVVMGVGINGIERDFHDIVSRIVRVAEILKEHEIHVFLTSIAPLRNPDKWNRFQYMEKIMKLNEEFKTVFEWEFSGYIDTFSVLTDETGQLAEQYAKEDGTHWTFDAYAAASKVVAEKLNIK